MWAVYIVQQRDVESRDPHSTYIHFSIQAQPAPLPQITACTIHIRSFTYPQRPRIISTHSLYQQNPLRSPRRAVACPYKMAGVRNPPPVCSSIPDPSITPSPSLPIFQPYLTFNYHTKKHHRKATPNPKLQRSKSSLQTNKQTYHRVQRPSKRTLHQLNYKLTCAPCRFSFRTVVENEWRNECWSNLDWLPREFGSWEKGKYCCGRCWEVLWWEIRRGWSRSL